MYDIPKAIQAVSDMVGNLFELLKKNKETQSETSMLKDRNNLKKATNIAEKLIDNTDGLFIWVDYYFGDMFSTDLKRDFGRFKKKHLKYKKQFERSD